MAAAVEQADAPHNVYDVSVPVMLENIMLMPFPDNPHLGLWLATDASHYEAAARAQRKIAAKISRPCADGKQIYSEMLPCTTKLSDLSWKPKGIILSGGQRCVYNIWALIIVT
jgi:hypothetical protein